jgi:hypothetical protein
MLSTVKPTPNLTSRHLCEFTAAPVPLSLLRSGQLLVITPDSQGGLLLDKGFYVDLVMPGAAVGGLFDLDCQAIHVIGTVQFYAPATRDDRAMAYQQRMIGKNALKRIILELAPLRRTHQIIQLLARKFGTDEIKKILPEWIARLVGVTPETVHVFWQRQQLEIAKKREKQPTQCQAIGLR